MMHRKARWWNSYQFGSNENFWNYNYLNYTQNIHFNNPISNNRHEWEKINRIVPRGSKILFLKIQNITQNG
jgi:hypothetical protein